MINSILLFHINCFLIYLVCSLNVINKMVTGTAFDGKESQNQSLCHMVNRLNNYSSHISELHNYMSCLKGQHKFKNIDRSGYSDSDLTSNIIINKNIKISFQH